MMGEGTVLPTVTVALAPGDPGCGLPSAAPHPQHPCEKLGCVICIMAAALRHGIGRGGH